MFASAVASLFVPANVTGISPDPRLQTRQRQVFPYIHKTLRQARVPRQEKQAIQSKVLSSLGQLVEVSAVDAARLIHADFQDVVAQVGMEGGDVA